MASARLPTAIIRMDVEVLILVTNENGLPIAFCPLIMTNI